MPQVKGGQKKQSSGRKTTKGGQKPASPARDAVVKQTADASSIIMGVFFLLAILVGAAAWMGQSMSVVENKANQLADGAAKTVGLSIKSIQIIEVSDDQENAIRAKLGIVEGDSMFRADPHALKARLDQLKGFGDIQVHRFWPNQVTVFVTPLKTSVMFRETLDAPLTPLHVTGEEASVTIEGAEYGVVQGEGAVEAWPSLLEELEAFQTIHSRLDYADRIGNRRWDLVMVSGVRISLPSGEAREDALTVLAALQRETGVLDRQLERVDLRDSGLVYVRKKNNEFALAEIGGAG